MSARIRLTQNLASYLSIEGARLDPALKAQACGAQEGQFRLRTATMLGFKNAKWITSLEVTNDFPETYHQKPGFNWFSGI